MSTSPILKQAFAALLLSRERETELTRRWSVDKDQQALDELTQSHLRLVASVAKKYRRFGLPHGDLLQEGAVGLMQAASRFDPERGVRFSTYAIWWVRAAIRTYVARNTSVVQRGSRMTGPGFASENRIDQSLDVPVVPGSDTSLQDVLVDEEPSPEDNAIAGNDKKIWSRWLSDALARLSEREQRIVRERHLGEKTATLKQLGVEFGISKERVRQIEKRAQIGRAHV